MATAIVLVGCYYGSNAGGGPGGVGRANRQFPGALWLAFLRRTQRPDEVRAGSTLAIVKRTSLTVLSV
jgi:hypothetical protein